MTQVSHKMAVPPSCNSDRAYFVDILNFLIDYQWLYDFPVTEILVHQVLNKIPTDWSEALLALTNDELNQFPSGLIKEGWPQTLKDFCERCRALCIPMPEFIDVNASMIKLPQSFTRGFNPKKKHEVLRLAQFVHKECESQNITKILDVGAGLGYLDELLYFLYGYEVLGLESQPHLVSTAIERQKSLYLSSLHKVQYVVCNISMDSLDLVKQYLEERLNVCSEGQHVPESSQSQPGVCILGLHACGDLSVCAMDLFTRIPILKLLILVPCCYHKMTLEKETVVPLVNPKQEHLDVSSKEPNCTKKESFHCFPLSLCIKSLISIDNLSTFARRPLLRLAAQDTCSRWQHWTEEEHKLHSFLQMGRALMELYAQQRNLKLKKKGRRLNHKPSAAAFKPLLDAMLGKYDFRDKSEELTTNVPVPCHATRISKIREDITTLWEQEYSDKCKLSEVLTALQMVMQKPVEHFILMDRIVYLKENNIRCKVARVMNDAISPRCHVLSASKS